METTIILALAVAVMIGIMTVSWGGRRFHLSTSALAIAFTLTAVCWLALIVAAIGVTVRSIALAQL